MTDLTPLLATKETVIAVVGATDSPGKYGGIIYRDLKKLGYKVLAVNPRRSIVDGDECFPTLASLPEQPDIIDVVVPAKIGIEVAREAIGLGYGNIWLQPGAESPALVAFLEESQMKFIADSCIMVRARQVLRAS